MLCRRPCRLSAGSDDHDASPSRVREGRPPPRPHPPAARGVSGRAGAERRAPGTKARAWPPRAAREVRRRDAAPGAAPGSFTSVWTVSDEALPVRSDEERFPRHELRKGRVGSVA